MDNKTHGRHRKELSSFFLHGQEALQEGGVYAHEKDKPVHAHAQEQKRRTR